MSGDFPNDRSSGSRDSGEFGGSRKKKDADKGDNALWRLPEWFPEMPAVHAANLKHFHGELLKFNMKVNLVSRSTERESDEAHFADCVLAAQLLLKEQLAPRVFDIGSGNGFPGLVMAILDAKREYVLVDSDTRKCEFLKHVSHVLGLANVQVMNVRFESLVKAGISVALSRGFASVSKTLLACNKIFEAKGTFYHLKGNSWSSEIAELPSQLISVWKPQLCGEYTLPVSQARRAIVITQRNQ